MMTFLSGTNRARSVMQAITQTRGLLRAHSVLQDKLMLTGTRARRAWHAGQESTLLPEPVAAMPGHAHLELDVKTVSPVSTITMVSQTRRVYCAQLARYSKMLGTLHALIAQLARIKAHLVSRRA